MIIRIIIFITVLVMVSAYDGSCEIYKWISDDGSMSYTDNIDKIPEQYLDQFEIVSENADILTEEDIEEEQEEFSEEQNTEIDDDAEDANE